MKTAIVLGTFDGLHAGHRAVIGQADGFYSIAVTFDTPPKSYFSGEAQLLMLPEDRAERLKKLGIDRVDIQDFGKIKDIEAKDYLEYLKKEYVPQRIVCGFNYRFGKNAAGDTSLIADFCSQNDIEFVCVPPTKVGDTALSSTYIRNLIREGNVELASTMIYDGFSFTATVIHGDARGRNLGFPTANQLYPKDLIKLKFGVYLSRVEIDGKCYKAITNVGIRPTYQTDEVGCETFIKDFSGDIYGKQMKTELLKFIREEQRFSSIDELKKAIINDVKLLNV
ncbi:MAG: riboflavin biosynthesis protein RibF [Clostridia bacterium]|nr:riboflavin biosynthesis protein RibF [Clostridia bacterium]